MEENKYKEYRLPTEEEWMQKNPNNQEMFYQ